MGMEVGDQVPLCRTCGQRVVWNISFAFWLHRGTGAVNCYPYASDRAEPTRFTEVGEL